MANRNGYLQIIENENQFRENPKSPRLTHVKISELMSEFANPFNVKAYGAAGDGISDDTIPIQDAINAAFRSNHGGTVTVPPGLYKTTAPIIMRSNIILQGAGEFASYIQQSNTNLDAIIGTDLLHAGIRDIHIMGPDGSRGSGTGNGIVWTLSGDAGNATFYPFLQNVYIERFGNDGLAIQTPLACHIDRVTSFLNGRHGINLYSTGEAAGTSTVLSASYAAGNYGAGFRLKQIAYSTLNGCAADANGIQYEYDTCIGLSENGCGSEEPYDFSAHQAGYTGFSRKVFNSKMTFNSPYMIGNIFTAFWVTNNSVITVNNLFEGSPGNTDSPLNNPTNSILVDSGCTATFTNSRTVTAASYANGTTTNIPSDISGGDSGSTDGNMLTTGNATIGRLQVIANTIALGASGSIRLTYFTAAYSGTYTQLKMVTGGTAAGATPTTCKMGLYSVDASENLTRIAITANDTTLFAAQNTAYTKATTSSFQMVAGNRYALAVIVVTGAALPTFIGQTLPGSHMATELSLSPRVTGAYSSQTDLPSSITNDLPTTNATLFYGVAL